MDPTDSLAARLQRIKVAVRISEAFRAKGFRVVQYGGATVEFYTGGLYSTGDVDIGFLGRAPSLDVKNQVMESLGCRRGVRLFNVDGVIVDLGGQAELYSPNTRELITEEGSITLEAAEEEVAQRLLMAVYPQPDTDQWRAAEHLVMQSLGGNLELDWQEVLRLARLPGFRVEKELRELVAECSARLGVVPPSGF
jgi:hypothetical protein